MKNNPLISVVVPIYNTSKYLPRCLNSIIHQTYQNLEIILIDDGSTDNSYQIAKSYAMKDPRVKLIHQKTLVNPPQGIMVLKLPPVNILVLSTATIKSPKILLNNSCFLLVSKTPHFPSAAFITNVSSKIPFRMYTLILSVKNINPNPTKPIFCTFLP